MRIFIYLAVRGLTWLSAAVILPWTVDAVHDWWEFVPVMSFGPAVSITLPGWGRGSRSCLHRTRSDSAGRYPILSLTTPS